MNSREVVYEAIDGEREYQDRGRGNAKTDRQFTTVGESILMLVGYAAQAAQQWNGPHPEGRIAAQHTIRKIAAIAVRDMELNGVEERDTNG